MASIKKKKSCAPKSKKAASNTVNGKRSPFIKSKKTGEVYLRLVKPNLI